MRVLKGEHSALLAFLERIMKNVGYFFSSLMLNYREHGLRGVAGFLFVLLSMKLGNKEQRNTMMQAAVADMAARSSVEIARAENAMEMRQATLTHVARQFLVMLREEEADYWYKVFEGLLDQKVRWATVKQLGCEVAPPGTL
jgi:hypothetical protein